MNHEMIKYLSDANGYKILPVKTGMQVELHERVGEGSTERIWKFKGLIIKVRKPGSADGSFTIRGLAAGQMIEKIYVNTSRARRVLFTIRRFQQWQRIR